MSLKNYERRNRLALSVNSLDHRNPLAITWLDYFRSSASFRSRNNYSSYNNAHKEAGFIEVIDISIHDPILRDSVSHKREPSRNKLGIFAFSSLVVILAIQTYFQLGSPLHEVGGPVLANGTSGAVGE